MAETVHVEILRHNKTLIARLPGSFGLDPYDLNDTRYLQGNEATMSLYGAIMVIKDVERVQILRALWTKEDLRNIIVFARRTGNLDSIHGELLRVLAEHLSQDQLTFA